VDDDVAVLLLVVDVAGRVEDDVAPQPTRAVAAAAGPAVCRHDGASENLGGAWVPTKVRKMLGSVAGIHFQSYIPYLLTREILNSETHEKSLIRWQRRANTEGGSEF